MISNVEIYFLVCVFSFFDLGSLPRYFSLQATQPVGFDDRVRFEVENNICREGGPLPTCFSSSQKIAYNRMEVGANLLSFLSLTPFIESFLELPA